MGRKVVEDPRIADLRVDEPQIGEAGRLCLAAWRQLESERKPFAIPVGMGGAMVTSGAIPWRAIGTWCASRGLGREETEVVVSVLGRLDVDRTRRENARLQELVRAVSGK